MTAALALLLLSAPGEALEARARTDTAEYLVGDWIPVQVELRHPSGTTFQTLVPDSLGPYRVLDRQAFEPVDSMRTRTALVVARYDSGTVSLPPLEFLASVPGDTVARRVATEPLPITVHTLPVTATDSLRALKDPLSIPYTLWEILGAVAVVALVVAAGYFLYRRLKRRAAAPAPAVPAAAARPAHVVALEELAGVKARRLWQQGRAKEYHSEVTDVLRRYFERRFAVPALEETTDEILASLRAGGVREGVLTVVETILRRADLAKFAAHLPSAQEHEDTMTLSVSVVERTRPATVVAPGPRPQAKVEHVGT